MTEHGQFNQRQRTVLLNGIDIDRVSQRAAEKGSRVMLSYLEQADVRAHSNRMFGHGGWDCETQDVTLVFEEEKPDGRWWVGYRVTMRLTVRNFEGQQVCCYSETAVGTPMGAMKDRGDAHDMAVKTASSDAMKRCFINLGDQFGLSLYWKGRIAPVVITTLFQEEALPAPPPVPVDDEESSESEPVSQEQEPQQVPPDTGAATLPEKTFEDALDEIRVAAVVPDSGIRLLALAGIKGNYPPAVFDRTTVVKGATVTLGALIDRASVGEFVPAEAGA